MHLSNCCTYFSKVQREGKHEVLSIEERAKVRRIEKEQPAKFKKRRKLDMDGKVWGEYVGEEQSQVDRFLKVSVENVSAKCRQAKLNVMSSVKDLHEDTGI